MLNRLLAVVLLAFGLTMSQLSAQTLKVPFGTLSAGPNLPTDVLKIIPLGDVAVLVHESGRLTLIDQDGKVISTLGGVPKGSTFFVSSLIGLQIPDFRFRNGKVYFSALCHVDGISGNYGGICAFYEWSPLQGQLKEVINLNSTNTILVKSLHGV